MDHLISMFMDNELGLDEKIEFVGKVHHDKSFKDLAIKLLGQEKLLRSDVVERTPQLKWHLKRRFVSPLWRPMAAMGVALAVALMIWIFSVPPEMSNQSVYRFVIFQPDISHAEISGSFTNWQNRPMHRVGDSGYWEITLDVPKGVHRFIYILDRQHRFPDPTLPEREKDDFGGENSILSI